MLKKGSKPIVLVVGASSGLLRGLLADLMKDYDVILTARRPESISGLIGNKNFSQNQVKFFPHDFQKDSEGEFVGKLCAQLADKPLWGILYGASLPPNDEDLLGLDRLSFENSMLFGGYIPILLAKSLASTINESSGGRLVFVGSNYAIHNSPKRGAVTYGLAKSSLVSTARAMAVELAKKKITVNIVSPDYIAVGMNSQAPARSIQMEVASNPMKRICTPIDVFGAVRYFLSFEAEFITAQELVISGGKS